MGILFGFAGRIGRLEYFLLSLGLAFVMTLIVFVMIGTMMPSHRVAGAPPTGMILAIVAVTAPIFLYFSLALQAKRFRDMGWNPMLSICGWIGAVVLDKLFALLVPALASATGGGTMVGGLINLAMCACLLFWPSQSGVDNFELSPALRELGRGGSKASTPSGGSMRSRDWNSAPASSGFGRRTL